MIYGVDAYIGKFGNKCGLLDFGNCGLKGVVKVYLDGKLSGEADSRLPYSANQKLEFSIKKNVKLQMTDEASDSVIQFNHFDMVPCSTGNHELFIIGLHLTCRGLMVDFIWNL